MNLREIVEKDGIIIDKGAVLTVSMVEQNFDTYTKWLNHWMLYPDLWLDMIHDDESDPGFHLHYYQRVALRAAMRYTGFSLTATRGTSKSFIAYLSYFLRAIFCPGIQLCIVADVKKTVIATARQTFDELFQHWPLLEKEVKTKTEDGEAGIKKSNDYYDIRLKNGSLITVISKDSSRGLRMHGILFEESAGIEEYSHNEVLLPMMTIDRREPDGTLNPEAINGQTIYITTASDKTCFMYSRLIELLVQSILRPDLYFIMGKILPLCV